MTRYWSWGTIWEVHHPFLTKPPLPTLTCTALCCCLVSIPSPNTLKVHCRSLAKRVARELGSREARGAARVSRNSQENLSARWEESRVGSHLVGGGGSLPPVVHGGAPQVLVRPVLQEQAQEGRHRLQGQGGGCLGRTAHNVTGQSKIEFFNILSISSPSSDLARVLPLDVLHDVGGVPQPLPSNPVPHQGHLGYNLENMLEKPHQSSLKLT